ncbi:D-2-hydroxyacid dehydrogenase family protein [Roseomonas indoligenes]|uniref:D-2-hydroxyacid dehydrogenase family protein n=1 Tax=Roseomonas indoligenes TaxID=2820811 RepID=A0A940S6B8_9PROT|nr:D-2-hydroxyacid dehydrogenase family protein [Pararoseomonas indoligenes]MBP0495356.1 D-2-hydroxyacid dehydrogenase family protein [Pararoseomonas indoligenes]
MRIAILDDYADAFRTAPAFARLSAHEVTVFSDTEKDPDTLVARLADMEALVLTQQRSRLPAAVIERLPRLRFIMQTGRNTAHLAIDACTRQGIVVSTGGAGGPEATAELAWGLIIAALRHIPEEAQRLREGGWQATAGIGLKGKTLGIYAYGRIGAMVARVGRAFDMRVLCWGREGSQERARADGFAVADSRGAFFAEADVLSLHILLNDATRGIVTAGDLARMKPGALLVNTSRAPIIAPGALVAALKAGRPGRAAVDVFDDEPVLGATDPLIGMPNVLCTPHLGYATRGVFDALYEVAVDRLLAFAAGAPTHVANPEAAKG